MVTKWGYSSSFPAKNVLLTFKMEGNGTFLENSKAHIPPETGFALATKHK